MLGGIDLGGTKIEASLFDPDLVRLTSRRIPTPRHAFEALLDALVEQHAWLCQQAGGVAVPVGIGVPGLIARDSGLSLTSNLPANGLPLQGELSRRLGFAVPVKNDCKCFALSEANGGAGDAFETVFGLILGTGCGGGVCRHGRLVEGRNGLPGEVGHLAAPARAAGIDLPVLPCNCGRLGCFETLVSGPGLAALARHLLGIDLAPEEIAAAAAGGDAHCEQVMVVWSDLLCELLRLIQGTIDPDCIVLGGGLSRIDGIADRLVARLPRHGIAGMRDPEIVVARFGDSSGTRGAAMLARPERN